MSWRRCALLLAAVGMLSGLGGCFSERSFPMRERPRVRMPEEGGGGKVSTREWAAEMAAEADGLLPLHERGALTQEDFAKRGRVVDVYKHFDVDAGAIDTLFGNWKGLEQTAQVASPAPERDGKGNILRAAWRGFKEVNVPVDGVELYGRLGAPDPKREIPGSYIVFTHGLFGTLDGIDTENQVEALRRAGHHVLAIEMRGHGETSVRHPEYAVSFGIRESADFIAVAEWLKKTQGATRVGLVSFSLTGYEALLTAWLDGARPVQRFENVPMLRALPRRVEGDPAFNAGMFVVSPPVDLAAVADSFEKHYTVFDGPCHCVFQGHLAERMARVGDEDPTTSMWGWAESELVRNGWGAGYASVAALKKDFVKFIDLKQGNWAVGVARMENVRAPVLVMAAANDPMGTAQGVVDLFSRVKNPNIGVVMLGGGGHMGFPAMSADYYYSMMLGFFDPKRGPGVSEVGEMARAPGEMTKHE
ncbi:MAG: alpha/beta fold hydrolase [Phycisphaerae bacterium]